MRIKHAMFVAGTFAATLLTSSLASEDTAPKNPLTHFDSKGTKVLFNEPRIYVLKSRGEEMVRLRPREGMRVEFEGTTPSGLISYDQDRQSVTASNGVTLKVFFGTNAVTLTADEVATTTDQSAWFDVSKAYDLLPPKLIHLKSGTYFLAQLKIPMLRTFAVEGKQGRYNSSGRATMQGDATMQISSDGSGPVVVKADEIEVRESE